MAEVLLLVSLYPVAHGISKQWMDLYANVFNQNLGGEIDPDPSAFLSAFVTGASPDMPENVIERKTLSSLGANGFSFPTRLSRGVGYRQLNRYYRIESASRLNKAAWIAVPGFDRIPATGDDVIFPFPEDPEKVFYRMAIWLE